MIKWTRKRRPRRDLFIALADNPALLAILSFLTGGGLFGGLIWLLSVARRWAGD